LKDLSTKILENLPSEPDKISSSRKKDHIEMAFRSQVKAGQLDRRFYYEPLLSAHPVPMAELGMEFLGKHIKAPLWVSSMTGGTKEALVINQNLAKACHEFGFGMGLGSCRSLLYSDERLKDFDLRKIIGPDLPFFANLGIAQIEELIDNQATDRIDTLLEMLSADGLIIHVNPMQEWLQPEGDRLKRPALESIEQIVHTGSYPVIVKEVGQGFGPESLKALFNLPLAAVDLAGSGGTNFALLEILRKEKEQQETYSDLAYLGHSAEEMIGFINSFSPSDLNCQEVIISGGIKSFLDGYYLRGKLSMNSVYGQASSFLKFARGEYQILQDYVASQIEGYKLAQHFLKIR